jgi:uncharacterized protein (DUF1015 family)
MHEHDCLHFHIQNQNLYKTEQKKLIVQFEKKKLTIICQKQNSRTNTGLIQIVAHLERFCLRYHLLKSYEK